MLSKGRHCKAVIGNLRRKKSLGFITAQDPIFSRVSGGFPFLTCWGREGNSVMRTALIQCLDRGCICPILKGCIPISNLTLPLEKTSLKLGIPFQGNISNKIRKPYIKNCKWRLTNMAFSNFIFVAYYIKCYLSY